MILGVEGIQRVRKRIAIFFLGHDTVNVLLPLTFLKGIAPITVVTNRDKLEYEEECKDALDNAATATGSSLRHTFFMRNYTEDNRDRNPETEKTVFDILNCALMNAERAVKIMKQKEKDKQEGEMMKALEGVTVSGEVAPDSADGNFSVCVFSLIKQRLVYSHFIFYMIFDLEYDFVKLTLKLKTHTSNFIQLET